MFFHKELLLLQALKFEVEERQNLLLHCVLPQSYSHTSGINSATQLNKFGLWQEYPRRPSHDPDGEIGLEDLSNLPRQPETEEVDSPLQPVNDSPLNPTQMLLTGWQNNGNATKSNGEMDSLARIIQHPDF
ncbi:hypothetical protein BT96DRAFT_991209 [Gymnopus androsaceus JB14]|uniref:Uncharacterized protein n=1 Tax=Gymnopus androsaceus JB14 TaxID=1447944 RepID=A0A6A4HW07_9AGAR|nr:hypothetical protein BT96DRAFT_991209 [Gymnopus androsaceus JB14]